MPEDWSTSNPPKNGDASSPDSSQLPGTPGFQHGEETGAIIPRNTLQQKINQPLPQTNGLPLNGSNEPIAQDRVWTGSSVPPTGEPPPTDTSRRWWKNWLLWAVVVGLCANGVALSAIAMLFKLPSAPNCPSIFWPLASGTVRIQCAQVAASKQTVGDLLSAIALVKALPKNHPMRADIDRLLQQWSEDIMALAEDEFQAGNLKGAIATANKIPQDIPSTTVKQQIAKWRSTWSEAESIYAAAEAEIPEQRWYQAFMTAVRLLNVGNNYWETTKYEQLKNNIETARIDGEKLVKAESIADRGGMTNLLAAFNLLKSVDTNSYMYKKAQGLIPNLGRKMLKLAQENLDRKDADEAIAIANQIPAIAAIEPEVQDFITIAQAKRNAWGGTVPSIETAILTAQKIGADRPLYKQAQELISGWQLEIEDVTHIEKARELAQPGTVADLTAAIAEASMIPESNPRRSEAKQDINRWQTQIQTFEDQPFLDQAEQLALAGQVSDLQAAINEASRIGRGRALYREARRKIRTWTRQIQTIEDQPYLDQARELASAGNLPAAITAARQILPGRALSGEAQAAIRDWQGQIQARENWREAQQIATQGTPEALAQAIRIADRVPTTSPLRDQVNPAINDWGQRILIIAQDKGRYDIPGAIAIAQQIPRSSDAYQAARSQIAEWNNILNPPPIEPSPESISEPDTNNSETNSNLNDN